MVAKMGLTDLAIRKFPVPEKGQKTYWDKGLGIRISQGGSRTFVVKHEGRFYTIGKYPSVTLKMARDEALRIKAGVSARLQIKTFSEALSAFLEDTATRTRPSTVDSYRYRLKGITKTRLSDISVTDVPETPQHRMAAKVFFNWCVRNEMIEKNPFQFIPVKWTRRSRVFSDKEIAQIWAYDFPPYSDYLKLLILTGQRRGQFKSYSLDRDRRELSFPASVMKNGKPHTIPLTERTASLLPVPQFNGWSRAKSRIDKHIPLPHWTVHDLRRTFSTKMASLQVPIHVTEAILSHSSGSISGVAATYNRYNYMIEMRHALGVYEQHLEFILGGRK